MSGIQKPSIFEVKIDNLSEKEIISHIQKFLVSKKYHHIITLNPEILLHSRNDSVHRDVLNASSLNIVDGIGIRFALWRQGKHLKKRFAGADLLHVVLTEIDSREGSVFLAVNIHGLSNKNEVQNALTKLYPHISFVGKDIDLGSYDNILNEISNDVVLCNFGAPQQEIFLHKLSARHAKIGIGIGGAFDYITGVVPRAPWLMRTIGMEWLYRLYKQPHRWKRIYNAVIIFPILILFNKK